jgi:tRNA U55 pseudouridine synthase TruB
LIMSLRRLRVGPFTADLGVSLDIGHRPVLLPLAMATAQLPALTLASPQIQDLRQGRGVPIDPIKSAHFTEDTPLAMFSADNDLVGIGKMVRGELRPVRILAAVRSPHST